MGNDDDDDDDDDLNGIWESERLRLRVGHGWLLMGACLGRELEFKLTC